MSLTNAPAAYRDCYQLYELAATTPGGTRTILGTRSDAVYFQMRMNQARVIQREQSKLAYPLGHSLHNSSEYDSYKVQILEDENSEWWVYVRPHGNWNALANAEPIPAEERETLPPAEDQAFPQITHQPKEPADAQAPDDLAG